VSDIRHGNLIPCSHSIAASREEERLHIHVQSADGEAKVWIEPEIEIARNYELSDQDLSRVLQLVIDHGQEIRDAWHKHFNS
jgi:Domain of unknown function (DUF4160)